MQSFRTEIENPVVERDIIELERKIKLFKDGKIDEERFRSLRLARGVYGQRQEGVQMIRIKLPYERCPAISCCVFLMFLMSTLAESFTLPHVRIFRFTM